MTTIHRKQVFTEANNDFQVKQVVVQQYFTREFSILFVVSDLEIQTFLSRFGIKSESRRRNEPGDSKELVISTGKDNIKESRLKVIASALFVLQAQGFLSTQLANSVCCYFQSLFTPVIVTINNELFPSLSQDNNHEQQQLIATKNNLGEYMLLCQILADGKISVGSPFFQMAYEILEKIAVHTANEHVPLTHRHTLARGFFVPSFMSKFKPVPEYEKRDLIEPKTLNHLGLEVRLRMEVGH